MRFEKAIVRTPSANFAEGLTRAELGAPNFALAKAQHERYCETLVRLGLSLTKLPADPRFPDSTFVEDTAVLTARGAILMRPGAESRRGEVAGVQEALVDLAPIVGVIEAPGLVDGGDVCESDGRFFIGLSERTDEEGARQLAAILDGLDYEATTVDLRGIPHLLHLKSGLAALEDGRFLAVGALAARPELAGRDIVPVEDAEGYAANAVAINGRVLLARGFPRVEAALTRLRYDVVTVEMSEFRKMDGGLSCLSLRL